MALIKDSAGNLIKCNGNLMKFADVVEEEEEEPTDTTDIIEDNYIPQNNPLNTELD